MTLNVCFSSLLQYCFVTWHLATWTTLSLMSISYLIAKHELLCCSTGSGDAVFVVTMLVLHNM